MTKCCTVGGHLCDIGLALKQAKQEALAAYRRQREFRTYAIWKQALDKYLAHVQQCGREAHKGKCEEEEVIEEWLPCPPLKVQTLKLRLIFAGEGKPSFTMQDDDYETS